MSLSIRVLPLLLTLAAPVHPIVLGLPGADPLAAQEAPTLVSTQWVAERLGREGLVLLHVGPDESFAEEHLPGARLLPSPAFAPTLNGLSTQIPDPGALRGALEEAGVSEGSSIVVYSATHPPQLATRLLLTLEYFGLGADLAFMDGGLRAWKSEGRPTQSGAAAAVRRGSLPELRSAGSTVFADLPLVDARRIDGGATVIDARDPQFWTGAEVNARARRPGRVPGATNIPFRSLVDDSGRLLAPDALRAVFSNAGIASDAPLVVYCHVGMQATLVAYAARLLGHEARVHDGSYEEWSARSELPVLTGP